MLCCMTEERKKYITKDQKKNHRNTFIIYDDEMLYNIVKENFIICPI